MSETITEAVEQIKNTLSLSGLDESATKQGVVLRLLSLAGWNAFDVSEVVPEYTVGNRRVDYALMPGSSNSVFIEVKRPGENLENHQQQLLEYCFQEGVKLAVLTNGRTWWLYLPLQVGSWDHRRFLTIDLEAQEPHIVEQRFMEYLSQEKVTSGRAVSDAEDLVKSQQREEITSKAIVEAWKQIIETPDEILVDLISETTERISGFKPDPELVEKFLSSHIRGPSNTTSPSVEPSRKLPRTQTSLPDPSRQIHSPLRKPSRRVESSTVLPITLDPPDSQDFKSALLHTKEAWIEVSYNDGRKEIRHWDAQRFSGSSDVMNNLRSRPEFRSRNWQERGIDSVHVSIERYQR